jgi:hypothetical protein
MKVTHPWMAALPFIAALLLSACGGSVEEEHEAYEPAHIEEIKGSELARVTLEERAAERIDLQTAPVEQAGNRLLVPLSAVIVDPEGHFWVYTNPEPLVFVRQEVSIEREEGQQVFLSGGPAPGTTIVTVGVQELWGAETGVDK